VDWSKSETGDCAYARGEAPPGLEQAEVLRRVAVGFRRVVIDWPEGERWAVTRAAKAAEDDACPHRGGTTKARVRRQAEWAALIDQWRQSGLSLPAFCQRHGLRRGTMQNWVYKPALRRAVEEEPVEA
jgi:hypothetical protein